VKVAVYTIALNEEQFVERWAESCKDADLRFIFDTGSTDGTVARATELGVQVWVGSVKPWRFDDARNASLAMLPADVDYCIALDMDEVLLPGWRAELEKAFEQKATSPRYQYTWSWNDDGTPGLQYGGDKIHTRHGYRWKHPVHEVLTADRTVETQTWTGLQIHHYPDNRKPRSQYLPLLAQAVAEDPYDDRNAFYYARELFFYGRYDEATVEFERHLSLPRAVWPPERAASMRYLAKTRPTEAERWLTAAVAEAPGRREPLVELAKLYYEKADWTKCLTAAQTALAVVEKPLEYLCEDWAWNWLPYDLGAIAAYNLGQFELALQYGESALQLTTESERARLQKNLDYYSASLQ
jgi:tetratricopeptide (TPR) repeat protein